MSPRPITVVMSSTLTFLQVISAKHCERNYFIWKHQVEVDLASHRLERFKSASSFSFYQSLCEYVQSRVLRLRYLWQIWDEIYTFFDSLIHAGSQLLVSELRTAKKGTHFISEFVSRIEALVHSLAVVGEVIS
ncbi:hypothetical protein Lal_00023641 [Lupinus albus]|nr:hypothetical protein Lal_00023641 [Lupinus albus]